MMMNLKTCKTWSYAVVSDIHFGHRRTPINHIVTNLKKYLFSVFKDIDTLFIAGDLFDRRLAYNSLDALQVESFFSELLHYCNKHNVQLRLLEGTPSHDWGQGIRLQQLVQHYYKDLDFSYITDITIEHLNGYTVLYIPDEIRETYQQVLQDVHTLLNKENIDKVDIAILHGQFSYQLPEIAHNTLTYPEDDFLSIVKHYIHIGHIHHFSVYDRIIAQGSFDRLQQGEEEDKGFILASIDSNNNNRSYTFIENRDAKVYKTYTLNINDRDKTLERLDKLINTLPDDSEVCIKLLPTNPYSTDFRLLQLRYPKIRLTKKLIETKALKQVIQKPIVKQELSLTPDTLEILLKDKIKDKQNFNEELYHQLYHKAIKNIKG